MYVPVQQSTACMKAELDLSLHCSFPHRGLRGRRRRRRSRRVAEPPLAPLRQRQGRRRLRLLRRGRRRRFGGTRLLAAAAAALDLSLLPGGAVEAHRRELVGRQQPRLVVEGVVLVVAIEIITLTSVGDGHVPVVVHGIRFVVIVVVVVVTLGGLDNAEELLGRLGFREGRRNLHMSVSQSVSQQRKPKNT